MKSKTVLIIDDDFSVHDQLSSLLMRAGIETVSAGSTNAAKAALDLCRVDAMLVDTALGSENSWGALSELRKLTKAPAIMLSDDADAAQDLSARKNGAKGVLHKPLVDAQVTAAVQALF